jgi:hypothetical protein
VSDARIVTEVDTGIQQGDQSPNITPGAAVELGSPLRLDQFTAELSERTGVPVNTLVLSANGDAGTADDEHPVCLWTDASGVAADALLDAAVAHVPSPTWNPDAPPGGMSAAELRDKATSGSLLSPDETQLALRLLLAAAFPVS